LTTQNKSISQNNIDNKTLLNQKIDDLVSKNMQITNEMESYKSKVELLDKSINEMNEKHNIEIKQLINNMDKTKEEEIQIMKEELTSNHSKEMCKIEQNHTAQIETLKSNTNSTNSGSK